MKRAYRHDAKAAFQAMREKGDLVSITEETPMFDDDIDWREASADFGLVSLCRELAALARPFEAVRAPRTRVKRLRAKPRGLISVIEGGAG